MFANGKINKYSSRCLPTYMISDAKCVGIATAHLIKRPVTIKKIGFVFRICLGGFTKTFFI